MKRYIVTIKTMYVTKFIQVRAKSSADALLALADELPIFSAKVTVFPAT